MGQWRCCYLNAQKKVSAFQPLQQFVGHTLIPARELQVPTHISNILCYLVSFTQVFKRKLQIRILYLKVLMQDKHQGI